MNHGDTAHAKHELADLKYIVDGLFYSLGQGEYGDALADVIEKNASKTLETHYRNEAGKIVREAKRQWQIKTYAQGVRAS